MLNLKTVIHSFYIMVDVSMVDGILKFNFPDGVSALSSGLTSPVDKTATTREHAIGRTWLSSVSCSHIRRLWVGSCLDFLCTTPALRSVAR